MDFHEQFNDSYERCVKHKNFFEIFYDLFFQRDQKFRQMFEDVDMKKQIKMIKASMVMILLASTSEQARESVRVFGQRHGPNGIGVNPADFDIWLECLLEAVSMCDPRYSEAVKQAWTTCFKEGIAIMKEECSSKD